MNGCNRAQALMLDSGYSLYFLNGATPPPKARSFELADDSVQYAPDRPADVKHVKLVITLDFEQETIKGTASTTFSTLYEEIKTISFDAIDLHIERVTLTGGASSRQAEPKELAFSTDGKKLVVTLDHAYHHGEGFTVAVEYHAKPRTGLHFIKPAPEDPTRPVQAWTFGQPRYHSYWFP